MARLVGDRAYRSIDDREIPDRWRALKATPGQSDRSLEIDPEARATSHACAREAFEPGRKGGRW
ncbi:hypothetical protein OV203_45055 [Nannocystis sp. ILAH1]|uniref:hypothetical protein n=1 Tax=Nannocystis sp. ILAH1 TaxID=2996789 RepID=UPI00226DE74D|nr:hypothetical protein [Nannocystis sp. ILAH1]MCY0994379.1 hypothetical protein [Nannocystis sp. ILAH1]